MPHTTPNATKRVLVTGAAKGIGAAIVKACQEAGYEVVAGVDEIRLVFRGKPLASWQIDHSQSGFQPLPPMEIDPPTLSMNFLPNPVEPR